MKPGCMRRTRARDDCASSQGVRHLAAGLAIAVLSGWTLLGAGIIELGKKGQSAVNSVFRVTVDGMTFTDPNHAGQTAEQILEDIRVLIDAHPSFIATTTTDPVDPNNIPAIRVRRSDSTQVGSLSVFEDDTGVVGAGGVANDVVGTSASTFTIQGVDAVAQNGEIRVDISTDTGPDVHVVVTTSGKTASQVNADIVSALVGNGFAVTGPASGPFTVSHPSKTFFRVAWFSTDTGVTVSGVGFVWTVSPPQPPVGGGAGGAPTLSEWGLAALVVLLGAAALIILARRNWIPSA